MESIPLHISFKKFTVYLLLIMSKVSFSTLAYCKMVAHAAKYPHCEVNGLLVAENSTKGDKLVIVDTVPLFHQCLHVSPMSEIDQDVWICNLASRRISPINHKCVCDKFPNASFRKFHSEVPSYKPASYYMPPTALSSAMATTMPVSLRYTFTRS